MPSLFEAKRVQETIRRDLGGYDRGGHRQAARLIGQQIDEGKVNLNELSLRDLYEGLVPHGDEIVRNFDPMRVKSSVDILEAYSAYDQTAFNYVTSRVVFARVREAFNRPQFVLSGLVETIPSRVIKERMPGSSLVGDDFADPVRGSDPYPMLQMDDDEVESHATERRGGIIGITQDGIFFDRTGTLLRNAQRVGNSLGLRKEKRIADTMFGLTGLSGKTYIYNGTGYNPYQTSTPWINSVSNELLTWDDVDEANQLLVNMTDPINGEPISVMPRHLLTMPRKYATARQIMTATEVGSVPADSSRGTLTLSPSPIMSVSTFESIIAYNQLVASGVSASNAEKYWLYGDLEAAFGYVENRPITVVQAPANSHLAFTQDVAVAFQCSERGVPMVKEPRQVVRCVN